jgi:5-formyltetrahydrofolate cyclo-ligase
MNQLKRLDSVQKKEKSGAIQKNLMKSLAAEKNCWGAFQALASEPTIDWSQVSTEIEWCFPVTSGSQLVFKKHVQNFKVSSYGVAEPADGEVIELQKLEGVIAPALAFSAQGQRLGRGKGFYDQTLEQFDGKKIGVCFDLSFCAELPHEEHDIYFNEIVTESSIYQVGHSEGDSKWN